MVALDNYKHMVKETFASVGQAIGIHVMLLVVERALWTTRHKYEEAAVITCSEEGVTLDGLDELDPERASLIAHFLMMSIISTLGRLVGIQLAKQLTEHLQKEDRED